MTSDMPSALRWAKPRASRNAATPPSAATYGLDARNLRNSRRARDLESSIGRLAHRAEILVEPVEHFFDVGVLRIVAVRGLVDDVPLAVGGRAEHSEHRQLRALDGLDGVEPPVQHQRGDCDVRDVV